MAYFFLYFSICLQHDGSLRMAGKNTFQLIGDVLHAEAICQKFGYYLAIGDEIDQRYILHFDDMMECKANEMGYGGLVTNHLRYVEKCCFQSGGTAGDECRNGVRQERISLVVNDGYIAAIHEAFVICPFNGRYAGNHVDSRGIGLQPLS